MSTGAKPKNMKKKGLYLPSRFKQEVEKVLAQSKLSKEKSMMIKCDRDSQELQMSGNSSQNSSGSTKLNISQDNRGMTSTPSSKGDKPLPQLDASVVTQTGTCLNIPHLKERIGPLPADSVKRNITKKYKLQDESLLPQGPVIASYRNKRENDTFNEEIANAELDLLYASYLQAAFLDSEAKKALQETSSNAIENLHKLFNLVLQYIYSVKTQNGSLAVISSIIKIHEHTQKQEDILKPVFNIIPTVEEQYKSLAEAVNATKHRLHVKDVILPEFGSEEEIIEIFQKMAEFISGFFEQLPNYQDIISSSDDLKSYVNAAGLITDALQRGVNLLVETRELYFSEASLAC